jgi:ComF family protein
VEPLTAEYYCVNCRTPFLNSFPLDDDGRCTLCRRGLNGFDAAYSYGSYDGSLRQLIQLLKYGRGATLAAPLTNLLMVALPREQRFDAIVPMPMHWRRRWERGFNQAELLARGIARRTGIPLRKAVRRQRATPPQAGLSSARRRLNMAGAFRVPRADSVQGRRILLIDDVMTTGASAGACAQALKRAGAAYVAVLTVARADRRYWAAERIASVTEFSFTPTGSLLDGQSGSIA